METLIATAVAFLLSTDGGVLDWSRCPITGCWMRSLPKSFCCATRQISCTGWRWLGEDSLSVR